MLRATSEIAVASSVWSVLVSSRSTASSRARWRAVTTSASDSMAIRSSAASGGTVAGSLLALEQGEALFQVQRRLDVLELHAQLDHGEGHLGLDADDHGLGAAQAGHHRDAAQGARDEGVHDVERGDVDDDPARAVARDLAHHVVAELQDVRVGQRRLDRRDQERALLEDGYGHAALPQLAVFDGVRAERDRVAEDPLGLLDAALQVADRVDLAELDAERDERLGDLRGQPRDDHARAHEPRGVDGLDEVVGHRRVDRRDAGDVDDDDLRPVGADAAQQLLRELAGALAVEDADDREDEQPLAHLQYRRRELPDRLLLLADDALALLDEVDRHGVGDPVRGRLVGVEDLVEVVEVGLVLLEQGSGQHVAQQQHDAEHLVRLDPARDDPLGQVARVVLQRLDGARLEHLDVVVVDGRRLVEDLLRGEGGQQAGLADPARPLLPEVRAVGAEMRDQLLEQVGAGLGPSVASRASGRFRG